MIESSKAMPTMDAERVVRQSGIAVVATYCRTDAHLPPQASRLQMLAGHGIDGDCHADPISPRHVLLASTGSYKRLRIAPNTLRENVLLDCERIEWPSGTEIMIGKQAKLRITFLCEPCAKLNKFRAGLSRDAYGDRGTLARIVESGTVGIGDIANPSSTLYPPFADDWHERVIGVLNRMPVGSWLDYRSLARLAGLHVSYCRTFPALIRKKAPNMRLANARVEKLSAGDAIPRIASKWDGESMFDDLSEFKTRGVAAG